jgi:hypothetical protein
MLVAMSGLKGSGKDTAAYILVKEYGFTRIAFADAVREMALTIDPYVKTRVGNWFHLSYLVKMYGWDQIKRSIPEVRRLLQTIGTEAGRMLLGDNVWIDLLDKRYPDISSDNSRYVITDCRFDNEVEFVRSKAGALLWISRPGIKSDGHASESTHIKELASAIIMNDGDIYDLYESIRLDMYVRGIDPVDSTYSPRAAK